MAIHIYMYMYDRLLTLSDSVLANLEVGFALGTSMVLPEDHKALESITALK